MKELTKIENVVTTEKFDQLQKTVNDQVATLASINVIDETSLAVANQQLSKTKQITNLIESARKELKEPYFQAGKQIDALAKALDVPLEEKVSDVKSKILLYNKEVEKKKQADLLEIQAKQKIVEDQQKALQQAEIDKANKLQIDIVAFEKKAFDTIKGCSTMEDLGQAYKSYVTELPIEYGDVVKNRIISIGVAKKNMLTTPSVDTTNAFNIAYATVTGTEVKVEAKVIEVPAAITAQLEQEKQAIAIQSAPSNIRKTWTFEVENFFNLPTEWLMPNEKAIAEWQKENKESMSEGMIYKGVKFFTKETVVTK